MKYMYIETNLDTQGIIGYDEYMTHWYIDASYSKI